MDFRSIPALFILLLLFAVVSNVSATGGVFRVQHKFSGRERSLNALKEHDSIRHRRILAGVDVPLGGDGHPTGTGLYFSKIGIGTPSKDYYVNIDTGSDLFWVNCIHCKNCPTKTDLDGVHQLTPYDPDASATGTVVTCDQDFCTALAGGPIPNCLPSMLCVYAIGYGDGSATGGYFVKDFVQYDRVSGNFQTTSTNASVTFGCGLQQAGNLGSSSQALDGILGFGQSSSSMISQLASSGKVKKVFSHCLNGVNGGGIFAIGRVVQPKVNTTPLVPNQSHYNVNMTSIAVGKATLQLPRDVFETSDQKGAVIDSGTTLAYLPKVVYDPLISTIMSNHSDLKVNTIEEQILCFQYNGSVDDGFPTVTFHFENSLSLMVYPHEYLFQIPGDEWCIGWQNSGILSKEAKDTTLLGDLVLSNKLVMYDLENQVIGWTEYNCSSSIQVLDEQSGEVYLVGAHDLSSSACSLDMGRVIMLLLLTVMFHKLIY